MSGSVSPTVPAPRISLLLWIVNLCAICASTLNYIYLSYYTYKASGSVFLSQVVLFAPMVLPVALVGYIQQVADRVMPRALLLASNLLSLGTCVVVYALLGPMPIIAVAGGVVIGTLDSLQRVARIVAIKRYFSAADVKLTVPLTLTAQFIAGGIAGAAIGLIREEMTPLVAMVLTGVLFAGAAAAAVSLPAVEQPSMTPERKRSLCPAFRTLLQSNKDLRRSFWVFIVFVSFFQGFFNVSRVTLPAHVLQLSEGWVGLLQSINSAAALMGALAFHALSRRGARLQPLAMALVSAVCMVAAAVGNGVMSSYIAYFLFIFFFELAFFRLQSDVVVNTPREEMPLVASVQYAGVYAGMISTILIGSIVVEQIGLMWTSVAFVVTYLALLGLRPESFTPAEQSA